MSQEKSASLANLFVLIPAVVASFLLVTVMQFSSWERLILGVFGYLLVSAGLGFLAPTIWLGSAAVLGWPGIFVLLSIVSPQSEQPQEPVLFKLLFAGLTVGLSVAGAYAGARLRKRRTSGGVQIP